MIKRFRSWNRGEPVREWTALSLLAELAPGLAPTPIRADLDTYPPTIAMSWLPGTQLGGAPLPSGEADALTLALDTLWQSVPPGRQQPHLGSALNSTALANQVRLMLEASRKTIDDSLVQCAYSSASAWLDSGVLDRTIFLDEDLVLGQGDCNLANFLWDGSRIRIVDFEDSGLSDRAFELANLVEHISAWSDAGLDADSFLARFSLTRSEKTRLGEFRRLAALFWLLMLLPGAPADDRNPPGTLKRQADRLLALLG